MERFIHYHSQNRRPWRSILRRLYIKAVSALLRPLLHQAFSSWPRRTEVLRPCIDYRCAEQDYSQVPLSTSPHSSGIGTSPRSHRLHQVRPPQLRTTSSGYVRGGKTLVIPTGHYEVPRHAVWISKRPLRIPEFHA